jgi:hypothetical protein
MIAFVVYVLCAVTSAVCALQLQREYRRTRTRLLLWSAIAFAGLAVSNALAFLDYEVVLHVDLSATRPPITCAALAALLYGLVWESD